MPENPPGVVDPTNPGGAGGAGPGSGPLTFNGITFGRPRFGGLSAGTLQRLSQILGGIPNLFDLDSVRGNKIRMGDLRRLMAQNGNLFNQGDSEFINQILGRGPGGQPVSVPGVTAPPGPGFSGVDEEGQFNIAEQLRGLLSDRELARLQSILGQRPNLTANLFKGGAVNLPDLRRLFNELKVGQAQDFIREILIRANEAGIGKNPPKVGPAPEESEPGVDGRTPITPEVVDPGGPDSFHSGGNPFLPAESVSLLESVINSIFESPGFNQDIRRDARNQIVGNSKLGLRDSLRRADERLASRGLGDSGLGERSLRDIERANLADRQGALTNFDVQNALFANQSLGTAMSGLFGLGNLNLGAAGLELDRVLGLGGLDIASRGLDLQEMSILLDAMIQELLINLQLGGLLGFGGGGGDPLGQLLGALPGGGRQGGGAAGSALAV